MVDVEQYDVEQFDVEQFIFNLTANCIVQYENSEAVFIIGGFEIPLNARHIFFGLFSFGW